MKDISYIDRMIEEKLNISIRKDKLEDFLFGNMENLSFEEIQMMKTQKDIMKNYIDILDKRIKFAFKKEGVKQE